MSVSGTTAWQSWIGRTTTATGWLDPEQANRMAVTLDREPTFTAGDPLPPAWQWLYFNDIVRASRLGEEGHPELGITMPPVPLPRRMWAAGRLEFTEPLRLGAHVQRRSTIKSVTPKQGGTGPLFFVTVEHDFSTDSVHHLLEEQTIVYREMSAEAELPRPPGAHRPGTQHPLGAGQHRPVPLLGAHLQRAPHPLRRGLRAQRRGLSGPGHPRPADRDAARRPGVPRAAAAA